MSVLSKALRYVVVISLLNGCVATNSAIEQQSDASSAAGSTMDTALSGGADTAPALTTADASSKITGSKITLQNVSLTKTKDTAGPSEQR